MVFPWAKVEHVLGLQGKMKLHVFWSRSGLLDGYISSPGVLSISWCVQIKQHRAELPPSPAEVEHYLGWWKLCTRQMQGPNLCTPLKKRRNHTQLEPHAYSHLEKREMWVYLLMNILSCLLELPGNNTVAGWSHNLACKISDMDASFKVQSMRNSCTERFVTFFFDVLQNSYVGARMARTHGSIYQKLVYHRYAQYSNVLWSVGFIFRDCGDVPTTQ